MKTGYFFAIEGTDGSGASTQCSLLLQEFQRRKVSAILTKEPTRGPAGAILQLALDRRLNGPNKHYFSDLGEKEPSASELDYHTMALLYAADRMDHVAGIIRPATERGTVVISDRYVLSTMAYQGLNVEVDWLLEVNRYAALPDLTVFLDVPPNHTHARMKSSRLTVEANDAPTKQQRVRESYRQFIANYGSRLGQIEIIDATKPIRVVARQILSLVESIMGTAVNGAGGNGLSLFDDGAE